MLFQSYRRRLEDDLVKWTASGLIQPEQAGDIRLAVGAEAGGVKLPAMLGFLGGLLLASSVIAFVASNWDWLPRIGKLVGILALIVAALAVALHFMRKEAWLASDAAATTATLIFGAGVALVGQMYHLPADWPAGMALVGVGALAVSLLMRSDGALIIAFACMAAWLFGTHSERMPMINWWYLAFYLPAFMLAIGRVNRAVHHAAVLGGIMWLAFLVGETLLDDTVFGTHIAYLLFASVTLIVFGLMASVGRLPPLFAAGLDWALIGFVLVLTVQLIRILDPVGGAGGTAALRVIVSGVLAVAALGFLLHRFPDRRGAIAMALTLALAMATSIVFWMRLGQTFAGRVLVSALILTSACAMIVAGGVLGQRRVLLAGATAFGLAIVVLLYRTVGSLLDQSLFFLVGGILLIAMAFGVRKLLGAFAPANGGVR
jgi:uncharacterized membrane protein